jgi:Spy/CpxP family protein refolding chaperone
MRVRSCIAALALSAFVSCACAAVASAQSNYPPPAPMQQWLKDTEHQGTLAPGTTITMSNWRQYKNFMPYGMQGCSTARSFGKCRLMCP